VGLIPRRRAATPPCRAGADRGARLLQVQLPDAARVLAHTLLLAVHALGAAHARLGAWEEARRAAAHALALLPASRHRAQPGAPRHLVYAYAASLRAHLLPPAPRRPWGAAAPAPPLAGRGTGRMSPVRSPGWFSTEGPQSGASDGWGPRSGASAAAGAGHGGHGGHGGRRGGWRVWLAEMVGEESVGPVWVALPAPAAPAAGDAAGELPATAEEALAEIEGALARAGSEGYGQERGSPASPESPVGAGGGAGERDAGGGGAAEEGAAEGAVEPGPDQGEGGGEGAAAEDAVEEDSAPRDSARPLAPQDRALLHAGAEGAAPGSGAGDEEGAGDDDDADAGAGEPPSPPPPSRTKWTRRVPHPVLIGHAASLSQVRVRRAPRGVRRRRTQRQRRSWAAVRPGLRCAC